MRGGIAESRHLVHVAVCDADGRLVAAAGDSGRLTVLRSCAKPWQARVLVESGALDRYGLDERTLAVACASHAGAPEHVAEVTRALAAAGVPVRLLSPVRGRPHRRLAHNCSGNHMGFLVASAAHGWPLAGYRRPDHPAQQAALGSVARACGREPAGVATCTDGCGVVAFALPLRELAAMFARIETELPAQAAAMRTHPDLVGGDDRLDTALMRAVPGCVAKSGAEGVHGLVLADRGLGVAVRVEDGAARAVAPAVLAALDALGAGVGAAGLDRFRRPELVNSRGERVGEVVAGVQLST